MSNFYVWNILIKFVLLKKDKIMETITIPHSDFIIMQEKIANLEIKVALLQDDQFMQKLQLAYQFLIYPKQIVQNNHSKQDKKVSIKRGSAKHIITFIADDFSAPMDDFKEYM